MIQFIGILADSIKQYLPQLDKAVYLARIDDEGRILMQSQANQNEYVYAGIKDNDSNYFYIRHRDSGEIFFNESTTPAITSCNINSNIISRYELKVVACLRNWCPYNTEAAIRRALMSAPLPDINDNVPARMSIRNASVTPIRSVIDSIAVLKEESSKPKQFDKNLIFVSVDFDLQLENIYF